MPALILRLSLLKARPKKCDIKDNKARVTYTVPFYSVNVAFDGGWMGAMGGTIPTRSDQNWPLDKYYPFAKEGLSQEDFLQSTCHGSCLLKCCNGQD